MVQHDLPFSERTAQMLMAIAADQRLRKANHGSFLPPSWRTLYEISCLNDEDFALGIADGIIKADMERNDLSQIRMRRLIALHNAARAKAASEPAKTFTPAHVPAASEPASTITPRHIASSERTIDYFERQRELQAAAQRAKHEQTWSTLERLAESAKNYVTVTDARELESFADADVILECIDTVRNFFLLLEEAFGVGHPSARPPEMPDDGAEPEPEPDLERKYKH
jgi:hypothetical protein